MAQGKGILKHPDKKKIDEALLGGESLRAVCEQINKRYIRKDNIHKQLNTATLFAYRKNYLNVRGEVLIDIRRGAAAKARKARAKQLQEQKAKDGHTEVDKYQSALQERTEKVLELNDTIKFIATKIKTRIIILEGANTKSQHLTDKVINEYLSNLRMLLTDYHNLQEKVEGQEKTEIHITINQVQNYAVLLKETIQEVLFDMEPHMVPIFLNKLQQKINEVKETELSVAQLFERPKALMQQTFDKEEHTDDAEFQESENLLEDKEELNLDEKIEEPIEILSEHEIEEDKKVNIVVLKEEALEL